MKAVRPGPAFQLKAVDLSTPQKRQEGVQAVWRGFYDTWKSPAAETIQRWWRGHAARRYVHALRHGRLLRHAGRRTEETAALVIQRFWRGCLARRRLAEARKAATDIQRWWRGYMQRREWPKRRRRWRALNDAATEIQRWFRGYSVRVSLGKARSAAGERRARSGARREAAAVVVQAHWRGHTARKRRAWLLAERAKRQRYERRLSAATVLQSHWRGVKVRRALAHARAGGPLAPGSLAGGVIAAPRVAGAGCGNEHEALHCGDGEPGDADGDLAWERPAPLGHPRVARPPERPVGQPEGVMVQEGSDDPRVSRGTLAAPPAALPGEVLLPVGQGAASASEHIVSYGDGGSGDGVTALSAAPAAGAGSAAAKASSQCRPVEPTAATAVPAARAAAGPRPPPQASNRAGAGARGADGVAVRPRPPAVTAAAKGGRQPASRPGAPATAAPAAGATAPLARVTQACATASPMPVASAAPAAARWSECACSSAPAGRQPCGVCMAGDGRCKRCSDASLGLAGASSLRPAEVAAAAAAAATPAAAAAFATAVAATPVVVAAVATAEACDAPQQAELLQAQQQLKAAAVASAIAAVAAASAPTEATATAMAVAGAPRQLQGQQQADAPATAASAPCAANLKRSASGCERHLVAQPLDSHSSTAISPPLTPCASTQPEAPSGICPPPRVQGGPLVHPLRPMRSPSLQRPWSGAPKQAATAAAAALAPAAATAPDPPAPPNAPAHVNVNVNVNGHSRPTFTPAAAPAAAAVAVAPAGRAPASTHDTQQQQRARTPVSPYPTAGCNAIDRSGGIVRSRSETKGRLPVPPAPAPALPPQQANIGRRLDPLRASAPEPLRPLRRGGTHSASEGGNTHMPQSVSEVGAPVNAVAAVAQGAAGSSKFVAGGASMSSIDRPSVAPKAAAQVASQSGVAFRRQAWVAAAPPAAAAPGASSASPVADGAGRGIRAAAATPPGGSGYGRRATMAATATAGKPLHEQAMRVNRGGRVVEPKARSGTSSRPNL